jgi:hypothetical protein
MGSGMTRALGICLSICTSFFTINVAVAQTITVDAAPPARSTRSVLRTLWARRLTGCGVGARRSCLPTRCSASSNAGWQTVTYRQNTELMVEAWHWNLRGAWSNAEKPEGYFVGSAEPGDEIRHSWAYPLPHRGFSRGGGNGWLRLTDRDPNSYWNPIAMLHSTPEAAANEIAYLYKRKYPISWIEMGAEADGQHMLPEDYGALYLQFATAIHKLVSEAKLGGPPFEGTFGDVEVWPDVERPDKQWSVMLVNRTSTSIMW